MSSRSLMADGRHRACIGVGEVKCSSCKLRRTVAGTNMSLHDDISTPRDRQTFITHIYIKIYHDRQRVKVITEG